MGDTMLRHVLLVLCLMMGSLVLSGCESAEERAEKHYLAGMVLLEEGDVERALVEFRNVFKLDGRHLEARLAYARVERDRGQPAAAYSQYLRVIEQYPDNFEALQAMADLALQAGDWDEVRRHGDAAAAINPTDPLVRSILVASDYQTALQAKNATAQAAAVEAARAMSLEMPDSLVPRRVMIDHLLRAEDWAGARAEIEASLLIRPDLRDLYVLHLGVLAQLDDQAALEAQLKNMTLLFPEDPTVHATLVRWYMSRNNAAAAEAHLRSEIDRQAADAEKMTTARMTLVRFLAEVQGPDAARAELDRIIGAATADTAGVAVFRALRAGLDFEAGKTEAAIADMQAILEGSAPSSESHDIRIGLARMLFSTGNQVGARAEVEQVLTEDPTQVEALKLKADWLINDDKTGDAMLALRAALDQSPRDPEVMTLMARAHERDGNRDLMGDMLSLAVEASNRAPEETIRYATFLAVDEKYLAAEEALLNALRLSPQNVQVLTTLGALYMDMEDWPRAQQVIDQMRRADTPEMTTRANDLTARLYGAQQRDDDLVAFLGALVADGQGGLAADAAIIRSHIAARNIDAALAHASRVLEQDPADPARRFIQAAVLGVAGKEAEAETVYRALLLENDKLEAVWQALYGLQITRGDKAAAVEVIDAALKALPASMSLRWAKASTLQVQGDLTGAIAVYEELYAEDTNSMVFANNLASLLSTALDDPESLERAFVVARRLRGSAVPAYQDTYGWIAFRRGNLDDALEHLEPAAKALTMDPSVQYHLGMTYARLGRTAEALAQFAAADVLLDPALPPEFLDAMRTEQARLQAAPPAGDATVTP
jgi:tetratricopeptide (TPR) repeat protein